MQHSRCNLSHNPKSLVNLGAWKKKNSCCLTIRTTLNELTSGACNGDNGAIEPPRIFLERVSEKIQQPEEMMTADSSLPVNDGTGVSLGLLESDLQGALSALEKKEEDLQDAERMVLLEQAKLSQSEQDMEKREQEIVDAFVKQKQMEKDLKKASRNLASLSKQLKDLKLLVKDQSKKIATSQSSLSLKEDEMCKVRDELAKKDEAAEILNSELESMKQLLDCLLYTSPSPRDS